MRPSDNFEEVSAVFSPGGTARRPTIVHKMAVCSAALFAKAAARLIVVVNMPAAAPAKT